eukprot:9055659-Pyramimonas_sp.AAC.1
MLPIKPGMQNAAIQRAGALHRGNLIALQNSLPHTNAPIPIRTFKKDDAATAARMPQEDVLWAHVEIVSLIRGPPKKTKRVRLIIEDCAAGFSRLESPLLATSWIFAAGPRLLRRRPPWRCGANALSE